MKKTTLALGMHDKLFKRARTMYQIEHCICDLLMTKGFLRIETPTLEHFEVFSDVVDNGNYNFFDKNGDLISLRPDITSQIGRVIASTHLFVVVKDLSRVGKFNRCMNLCGSNYAPDLTGNIRT